MNKLTALIIAAVLSAMTYHANCQDESQTDSNQSEDSGHVEEFTKQIQQLSEENSLLKQQLSSETESLEYETSRLNSHIRILEDEVAGLKNENNELLPYKEKYDSLKSKLERLDVIIYKQCLLYPLERQYSHKFVSEALNSVWSFTDVFKTSKDFNNIRNTYEPLVKNYGIYNEELINFFDRTVMIRLNSLDEISADPSFLFDRIKDLQYYKDCYVYRNRPPYNSIIYLDNIIDRFLSLAKQRPTVKTMKAEIEKILKDLKPKP